MAKTETLERPPIKREDLKWGVPDINTGYSFDQAIKFVRDFQKTSDVPVPIIIHLGMTPSSMSFSWPREHKNIFLDFPFYKNTLFITGKNPKQETYVQGTRDGLLPHEYLIEIKKNTKEKTVSPIYTINIYAEEDGRREFRSRVKKILDEFPEDWTFWELKKSTPQTPPTKNSTPS